MKSLSLKVMTLLMAALVLSVSGCFNENERSSPEGTVKGYYKAAEQLNFKKVLSYFDPRELTEEQKQAASDLTRVMRARATTYHFTIHKVALVSKEDCFVWMEDKMEPSERATVEVRLRSHLQDKLFKYTDTLVLLNNVWYIEERVARVWLNRARQARAGVWP